MCNNNSATFGKYHYNTQPTHGSRASQRAIVFDCFTDFPQPWRMTLDENYMKRMLFTKRVVRHGLYEELQHFYLNWEQFL